MILKNTLLKLSLIAIGLFQNLYSQNTKWKITNDNAIVWKVSKNETHIDNIEMSGFFTAAIVYYGVEKGILKQKVKLIFPMLRTIPNDTHASLIHDFNSDTFQKVKVNGKPIIEKPTHFFHKGIVTILSETTRGIKVKHQLFPTTDDPVFIDKVTLQNTCKKVLKIEIPNINIKHLTPKEKGVKGAYLISAKTNKKGFYNLAPNETLSYSIIYAGRQVDEDEPYIAVDFEYNKRKRFIKNTLSNLILETPDKVLNTAFSFAKIRAVESIFKTKGGLMHAPGGSRYYAAIWANDQAEYANPFFPFLGNDAGNESAINAFRHFARFINESYKPIPSSIIAEGLDFWNGAGDRGDMAMIAYGACRFAMAYGKADTAKQLWNLIKWCLEYCRRKINKDGVVASDSDELEGRFPAGKANLNTSCLYYDALISAVELSKELGVDKHLTQQYAKQAQILKTHIENYFGSIVSGYKTYRYYKGNKVLRAWICTPLTVDIFDRGKGTIDALFSDKLWTKDGLASKTGSTTFWDRATLYALRGVFAAGETKKALDFLQYYSKRRLLGKHVPYPVEAYPEGNQRHLSAESALYCRVITEGLFGIRPLGFQRFALSAKLPKQWHKMTLKNIRAFNSNFNIEIKREKKLLIVRIFNKNKNYLKQTVRNGTKINVNLSE